MADLSAGYKMCELHTSSIHPQLAFLMLNILVIHGYVQSAATVAHNTRKLRDVLDGVAVLHYVDGPPMPPNSSFSPASRPWWILGQSPASDPRWQERW
ncbi:FSH1 domain-containing protein [Mycena sanguinolenta]|uniref:FSH1 domain-containing protein n=1 Tax=Mycena sanguinolenta TaxID=230812 RepID=A0A8H6TW54_9AGAR|nr:FSH1 domain-containing protein [Mycena sanguinolenta]